MEQKGKDLVFDYTNRTTRKVGIVPMEIMELCFLFYFVLDQWDREHTLHAHVKIDGCTVQKINGSKRVNAFLQNTVDSGTHVWRFKVEDFYIDRRLKHKRRISVGLWEVNDTRYPPLDGDFSECFGMSHAIQANGWDYDLETEKLNVGDIIELRVNFNASDLRVTVNDKLCGMRYMHCTEPKRYRAAVNLFVTGDAVSLLYYSAQ